MCLLLTLNAPLYGNELQTYSIIKRRALLTLIKQEYNLSQNIKKKKYDNTNEKEKKHTFIVKTLQCNTSNMHL